MFDQDYSFVEHCESIGIKPRKGFYTLRELSSIFPFELSTLQSYTKGKERPPFELRKVGKKWCARRDRVLAYFYSTDEHIIPPNIHFFPRNHNNKMSSTGFKNNSKNKGFSHVK